MTDTREQTADLVRRIAVDQSELDRVTGRQLESIVAEIMAQQGQLIEGAERAARADLVLQVKNLLGQHERMLLECKKVSRAIGEDAVRQLQVTTEAMDARRAILVSTSSFTAQARTLAGQVQSNIQLIDRTGLLALVRQYETRREEFAAALAYRIGRLSLSELGRLDASEATHVEKLKAQDLPVAEEYQQRIVQVDCLPLRVLGAVLRDPRTVHGLEPREFEHFVAEVVDRLGFTNVILTPRSGDGGRDVIASNEVDGIPLSFYFECKKYSEGNKVQLDSLRSLLGVVAHDARRANIGVLVTTSSFTAGSKQLILSDCRLDGKDYDGIVGWVSELKKRPPV